MSEIISHYDRYYDRADGISEWRTVGAIYKAKNVRDRWAAIGGSDQPSIIDIGCGEGAVLDALVGFFSEATGLDVSSSGIVAAQARGIPQATFAVTAGTLPSSDKCYDLAILSHVVEHLEDPRSLIKEAARVAHFVFIEVPLELNRATPQHFEWTELGHINLYSPLLIRHLVESCGLRVADEAVTHPGLAVARRSGVRGVVKWAIKSFVLAVSPGLATRLFTYHGTIIATVSSTPLVGPSTTGRIGCASDYLVTTGHHKET